MRGFAEDPEQLEEMVKEWRCWFATMVSPEACFFLLCWAFSKRPQIFLCARFLGQRQIWELGTKEVKTS